MNWRSISIRINLSILKLKIKQMESQSIVLPENKVAQLLLKKLPLFIPYMTIEDLSALFSSTKKFGQSLSHYSEMWMYPIFKMAAIRTSERPHNKCMWWFEELYRKHSNGIDQELKERIQTELALTKSLIKNPSGESKFKHWHLIKNGGDGWSIERSLRHETSFCGSYDYCEMYQEVDLPGLIQDECLLLVGAYLMRRSDCPAEATISAKLFNEEGEFISTKEIHLTEVVNYNRWKLVCLRFGESDQEQEVLSKVRKVQLILCTKDKKFWQGHYGARFSDAFVRIIPKRMLTFD